MTRHRLAVAYWALVLASQAALSALILAGLVIMPAWMQSTWVLLVMAWQVNYLYAMRRADAWERACGRAWSGWAAALDMLGELVAHPWRPSSPPGPAPPALPPWPWPGL